jgi:nucleotide-binding universal stress UspA family protein
MGSTTLSILQQATVPVLAIPPANAGADGTVSSSWPGERIVAPVELDAESRREADVAARIAQWFGSSLLLLHVVGDITAPAWMRGDLSAHDRIRVAQAQQRIDALATEARRRVETEGHVVCGRIADEIAAFAAGERTGLAITSLRDRHAWFGARRGSVSYHLLSEAVTPVLAYPPRWRPR